MFLTELVVNVPLPPDAARFPGLRRLPGVPVPPARRAPWTFPSGRTPASARLLPDHREPRLHPAGGAPPGLGGWLFGCDDCQEVCPFNARPLETSWPELSPERGAGPWLSLAEVLALRSDDDFKKRCAGTPILRAKRAGLVRNACVVARNRGAPPANCGTCWRSAATRTETPWVREHAAWALAPNELPRHHRRRSPPPGARHLRGVRGLGAVTTPSTATIASTGRQPEGGLLHQRPGGRSLRTSPGRDHRGDVGSFGVGAVHAGGIGRGRRRPRRTDFRRVGSQGTGEEGLHFISSRKALRRGRPRADAWPGSPRSRSWRASDDFEHTAGVDGCVYSNEFFDALPVHRVRMESGALRELFVVERDGRLAEEAGAPSTDRLADYFRERDVVLEEGQSAEVCLAMDRRRGGSGTDPGPRLRPDGGLRRALERTSTGASAGTGQLRVFQEARRRGELLRFHPATRTSRPTWTSAEAGGAGRAGELAPLFFCSQGQLSF